MQGRNAQVLLQSSRQNLMPGKRREMKIDQATFGMLARAREQGIGHGMVAVGYNI